MQPNRFFDPHWYQERHLREIDERMSPLGHYVLIGWRAGLPPGPDFDPAAYFDANPDVKTANLEPLGHFLRYGVFEGRSLSTERRAQGGWFEPDRSCPLGVFPPGTYPVLSETAPREPAALHILHGAGGGTERAVSELLALYPDVYHVVLMANYVEKRLLCTILSISPTEIISTEFILARAQNIADALSCLNIGRIHIHQPMALVGELFNIISNLRVPYEIHVHDYTLLCPRNSFVGVDGRYCGEPAREGCSSCLKQRPLGLTDDIYAWRSWGRELLDNAAAVHCAVEDVANRISRYAPASRTIVKPLQEPVTRPAPRPPLNMGLPNSGPLRVAVIGHVTNQKGGDFLLDCIDVARTVSAPIEWIVMGSFSGPTGVRARRMSRLMSVTGTYNPESLGNLIREYAPEVIFFPQRCVETWSFSLTEALDTGLPIVAADVGAIAERLRAAGGGHLFPVAASPAEALNKILSLRPC